MDNNRECIILAGGLGTRLRGVIKDVPKPMAPLNGKPFLYYVFKWLAKYKTDKIVISAGYKSESIIKYFGNSFNAIPLVYAIEEKPLGTGGAVKFAIRKTTGANILIINGDTYFPVNLDRFWKIHTENNFQFTIALKRMYRFSRYGSVELEGETINMFNEKQYCSEGLINGGIYLTNRYFIESLEVPEVFSLEKDVLVRKSAEGVLKGIEFDDTFIDIGIPEDYSRAEFLLKDIDSL